MNGKGTNDDEDFDDLEDDDDGDDLLRDEDDVNIELYISLNR